MHVSASAAKQGHHTVVLTAQAVCMMQRFLQEHGEVRITAMGIAVAPAVSVAEILKNRQLATEKQIFTALESVGDLARYLLLFAELVSCSPCLEYNKAQQEVAG